MALQKAALQASLKAAIVAWNNGVEARVKDQVKAACVVGLAEVDPANQAAAVDAWAGAIAKAVTTDLNGEAATTTFADALGTAIDTFVKGATLTFSDAGLQVTTGLGTPTGPPVVPLPVDGMVS